MVSKQEYEIAGPSSNFIPDLSTLQTSKRIQDPAFRHAIPGIGNPSNEPRGFALDIPAGYGWQEPEVEKAGMAVL